MPISHDKKFIFVHLVKTAGSSIEKALNLQKKNELYGFEDKEGNHIENAEGMKFNLGKPKEERLLCLQHLTAAQIRARYSKEIWDSYFKFAFVRNPWELVVSQYSYVTQRREGLRQLLKITPETSFEDFVMNTRLGVSPQHRFLVGEEGEVIVDFVGRFERLAEDFGKVCERIGVEASLPMANKSKHDHYRDYYNEKTKNRVSRVFAKDIELFGYEF